MYRTAKNLLKDDSLHQGGYYIIICICSLVSMITQKKKKTAQLISMKFFEGGKFGKDQDQGVDLGIILNSFLHYFVVMCKNIKQK